MIFHHDFWAAPGRLGSLSFGPAGRLSASRFKPLDDPLRDRLLADEPVALVFEVGVLTLRIQKVVRKPKLDYTVLGWMVADIEAEIRRLVNAGVTFCRFESLDQDADGVWRSPGGAKVAWFRDPDGNTLSLTEKR